MQKYFKRIAGVGNCNCIYSWKSRGLSDERINSIKTSDYGITPYLSYYNANKIRLKSDRRCLKQDPGSLCHGRIVNVYIVDEITKNINISDYPTLKSCLLGAFKLTKNVDIDKHGYSRYGIGFGRHGCFSFPGTRLGKNITMFGVDMNSSTKIDNRKKDIVIIGKGLTLNAEKM